jgi:protein CpxP
MQRKTIRRIALASAIAVATPLAVMAQQSTGDRAPGAREGGHFHKAHFHRGHRGHHGHFHGASVQGGPILRGLDLTEEQRDKLFELRHAQAPKMRELGKTAREARRELRAMSMSDRFDEARAKELADKASQASAGMALLRAQLGNETYKILTPEQREKLAKRAEMHKRGPKGPRGGEEARG